MIKIERRIDDLFKFWIYNCKNPYNVNIKINGEHWTAQSNLSTIADSTDHIVHAAACPRIWKETGIQLKWTVLDSSKNATIDCNWKGAGKELWCS